MRRALALLAVMSLGSSLAQAHYHMLLPQEPSAKKGVPISFIFQFGHPFEHQLFDTASPESLIVVLPDGKVQDLTTSLRKRTVKSAEPKDVTVYRFEFTPEQRGDYTFIAKSPPQWMEEEQLFFQDTVRTNLHVLTQKGWDNTVEKGFQMVPLTRPYGLRAKIVFQAQAIVDGKPLSHALVEVERMNLSPPKILPADEQITRTLKTDPNGVATCSLLEPGWWCITAQREGGKRERQGKMFPVRERSSFWVFVDGNE